MKILNIFQLSCGYEFTNKLHRMYTDMTISYDLNDKFSTFVDDKVKMGKPGLGVNFNILVLQDGAWPIGQGKQPAFSFPQQLERSAQLVGTLISSEMVPLDIIHLSLGYIDL